MSTLGKQSPRHASGLHFQRILVAVDGSEGSARASEVAVDLAERLDAQLFVLNVYRGYPEYMALFPRAPSRSGDAIQAYESYPRKAALEVLGRALSIAERKGGKATRQTSGSVGSVVQAIR